MKRMVCTSLCLILIFCLSACQTQSDGLNFAADGKPDAVKAAFSNGGVFELSGVPWETMEVDVVKSPAALFGTEPKQVYSNHTDSLSSTTVTYPCTFAGHTGELSLYFISGGLEYVRFDFNDEDQAALYTALLDTLKNAFGKAEPTDIIPLTGENGRTTKTPVGYEWTLDGTKMRLFCNLQALTEGHYEQVAIILDNSSGK